MAGNFDKIVGPEGEWLDDEGGEEGVSYVEPREEFVVRCLNSAVNLYGIITVEEFLGLYNIYAKNHEAPISDPLGAEELERIARSAVAEEDDWDAGKLADDAWFRLWTHPKNGERLIVYWSLVDVDESDLKDGQTPDEWTATEVDFTRGKWQTKGLKVLSEKAFLCYEDPAFGEESDDMYDLAKVFNGGEEIYADDATSVFDVHSIVATMRVNGPSFNMALLEVVDLECEIDGPDEYRKIIKLLKRIMPATRAWAYRGRTQRELVDEGIWRDIHMEKAPTFREWQKMRDEVYAEEGEADGCPEDDSYDEDSGNYDDDDNYIHIDRLPLPESSDEPFDFKKVKDSEWRAKTIQDYTDVSQLTVDFVRDVVIREVTQKARKAAAKRLGFTDADMSGPVGANLDMVVGDFAAMMDDQNGEPAIKKVLSKRGKLVPWQKFAADYYEQYRYTWLEVQAVKAGCGLKCRDLLTGKDLFLMEKSFSLSPNARGMTICAGIAPMGEVYIVLGLIHPVNFENPATILKIVLTHLGIPSEIPISLSFADQARFAAETIRRIHALGKFATIGYGG